MPYPYYPNNQFYMQNMQDLQSMRERIDKQMQQMQQQNQNQIQQPQVPQIHQNFQLAPNTTNSDLESKYANSIDEVRNTFVMKMGIFINKDFDTLWVKSTDGNIRIFALSEVIEQDPKDIEIMRLKKEIEEMKGMMSNVNESDNSNANDEVTTKKSTRVSNGKSSNAK